ncbi:MAG: hypothetical protein V3T05_11795, partial [Myxococcota bacterium]
IPVGAQDVGEACDELADRCLDGLACVAELDGSGTCRALCGTADGTWPTNCDLQEASSDSLCTSDAGCCIDMSCFSDGMPPGDVGIQLPDFGLGCNMAAQSGCATGETCLPQSGAWDRGICEPALGTAGVAEQCDADGTGARGCAAGLLCLPFMDGPDGVCVEICDPNIASNCTMGNWLQQPNCIDIVDFGDTGGPPAGKIGLCLPLCQGADDCDVDQICLIAFGPSLGMCLDNCDAATDQGGGSAECAFGSVCIADLENSLADFDLLIDGTGTCDETTLFGGASLCTVVNAATDCASETCIESATLGAGEGVCANFDTGQLICSVNTGNGCPAGEACFDNGSGDRFCAQPVAGATCDTAGDCTGLGLANPVCVPVAPIPGVSTTGQCAEACTYNTAAFPDAASAGTGCPSTGGGGPPLVCYHVPTGAADEGFCSFPWAVPGSPEHGCDPDIWGYPVSGNTQCAFQLGGIGQCLDFGSTAHEPTRQPEGICITRCLAGAVGDTGTCFGNPSACVPDADTTGQCLAVNLLDPPCDIATQTGCAPFETCRAGFFPLPPGGFLAECDADIGTAGQGDACVVDGAQALDEKCALGLLCVEDVTGSEYCVMACAPAAPSCATGFACVDVSQAFFGSLGHLGFCLQDDGCSVVDDTFCAVDETCAPVGFVGPKSSANHAQQCVGSPGTAALGDSCWQTEDNGFCDEGTYCAVQLFHPNTGERLTYCTSFCDPGTATGNTECPLNTGGFDSSQVCDDVSDQLNAVSGTYGVCVK